MHEEAAAFLEHYGVKGMKWGVRKDRDSTPRDIRRLLDTQHRLGAGTYNPVEDPAMVANAAIVSAILVTAGAYHFVDGGGVASLRTKLKGGHAKAWKKDPSLAVKNPDIQTMHKIAKPANPYHGERGTKLNCRRCTMAYEMRRRGFDVQATRTREATGQTNVGLIRAIDPNAPRMRLANSTYNRRVWMDSATEGKRGFGRRYNVTAEVRKRALSHTFSEGDLPAARSKALKDQLATFPDGARGELAVWYKAGGGHSMAWEISGGKAHIIDAQNGQVGMAGAPFVDTHLIHAKGTEITRLDNEPLNQDFLTRWVK